ncbi:extracellular solute-binding protein [Roseibium suaedae]|uniref:Microcin C transport system substrate-binding protein n=1 Tax=Roseibium suaedae TaxID=735517 RepID=A0A1M6Z6A1_9HYPH|nr:extracellular solute-binding protein [Roseibium suaedae]SHL25960.1 microcin C transport system substrate-binding protein [Roseibium suaedae]
MTGSFRASRRQVLLGSAAVLAAVALPRKLFAAEPSGPVHGLSVFGELKYPATFQHFDYINPAAPKGGRFSFKAPSWGFNQNPNTFNTFNSFVLKGDAPPRMELCFDTLMVRALDEPDAIYGLVAESVEIAEGGNTYIFNLRPEARFHDGSKLTAEDVAFSFNTLKADGHPQITQAITQFNSAEALSETQVAIHLSDKHTKQLPMFIASSLPILSKRYYTAYDFKQSTLTPPLSSGPYKVGKHEVGRFVEYDRVKDYWANDLPVMRGSNNFDVIRLEFFRDYQVSFESFKKGNITFQEEFSSKIWSTEYNFPAIQDGRVVQKEFPDNRPSGAQGWFFNTRRKRFSDPRIRQALGFAFDFEWSNRSLFYGLYSRTQSYFQNSEMMATGTPGPEELALLEPYRGKVPDTVFGEAILQPVSDGTGSDRKLLRRASQLLQEAGCKREGSGLLDPEGKPFTMEILGDSPSFERIVLPFINNLKLLGVQATFRVVDAAQFQSRLNDFDFDVTSRRYSLSATLSDDSRETWVSSAAERKGSRNLSGISDPVIDELVDKAVTAKSREEMNTAAHALDRVLRSGHYWIPQWYKPVHTVAIWDIFGYPDKPPHYDFPIETTWWFDQAKAEKAGKAG